jgi:hypothetical protein
MPRSVPDFKATTQAGVVTTFDPYSSPHYGRSKSSRPIRTGSMQLGLSQPWDVHQIAVGGYFILKSAFID